MSALNATKRDLAEFMSVLGTDTKAVVKGASDNINKILVQSPSNSTDDEAGESEEKKKKKKKRGSVPVVEVQETAPYDRSQAELFSIQNSSETYLQDPSQGNHYSHLWATKIGMGGQNQ